MAKTACLIGNRFALAILALATSLAAIASPLQLSYGGGPTTWTTYGGNQYTVKHQHVDHQKYTVSTPNDGLVYTNPDDPVYLAAPTAGFLAAMQGTFKVTDGWTYANAANPLSDNSLLLHLYKAYESGGQVGAEFFLEYHPNGGTDPTLNLHWIQVFHADHEPDHGDYVTKVDYRYAGSPYYEHGGTASDRYFYDNPYTSDSYRDHAWDFEVFLVGGPAVQDQPGGTRFPTPGALTFYGGVSWGWANEVHPSGGVPEPATVYLSAGGLLILLVARRRRRSRVSGLVA